MAFDDDRDPTLDALDDAVAQHYARQQDGLPPPVEPHPGYATFHEALMAHRRSGGHDPTFWPEARPVPPEAKE